MKAFPYIALVAALVVAAPSFASGGIQPDGAEATAAPAGAAGAARFALPALGISEATPATGSGRAPANAPRAVAPLPVLDAAQLAELESAARRGDTNAAVALGARYEQGEGVPRDALKSYILYCRAARYGHTDALFNLGRAYAEGKGVTADARMADVLLRRAAGRGHAGAAQQLAGVRPASGVIFPPCLAPAPLPVAALPRALPGADRQEPQIPAAPKEIAQLVRKLAPLYAVDSNLALAVMWAESAFDPQALSAANAMGLMQLIPDTAERFGVKNPLNMDENIKGGLAYLRWLLAYFRGDVPLVLAAYNAGEGAVDKHGGIPPYAETREYVQKIIGVYRRLAHPYIPGVASPSPLVWQSKRTM